MPDAEKALTGWPLEPGPPRGLEMALLSSPRPRCDLSLDKGPERGLVQARIMRGKGRVVNFVVPGATGPLRASVAGL